MRTLPAIEAQIETFAPSADAVAGARTLLALAEEVLEHWVEARGQVPTTARREGSRLLGLHRQGSLGVPSFNACRETCREIAYHFNLLQAADDPAASAHTQAMMQCLVRHLLLFVSGKLVVEGLGDFCCASRPLRVE